MLEGTSIPDATERWDLVEAGTPPGVECVIRISADDHGKDAIRGALLLADLVAPTGVSILLL